MREVQGGKRDYAGYMGERNCTEREWGEVRKEVYTSCACELRVTQCARTQNRAYAGNSCARRPMRTQEAHAHAVSPAARWK